MTKRIPVSIGDRFGDWTVISESERKRYDGCTVWLALVKCKCGRIQRVQEGALKNGKTMRCKKCSDLLRVKVKFTPGDRLGKWTILGEVRSAGFCRAFEIACDCGNKFEVLAGSLKKYNYNRCAKCDKSKHGMSSLPEYFIWRGMIDRCYNVFNIHYDYYGGKGVTVCDRWNPRAGGSFENFYADMGSRPSEDYQLDKEAVFIGNKIYCPEFVKWSTSRDNYSRRSNSVFVDFNNEKIALAELAAKFSINYYSLYYKIKKKHLSSEEAVRSLIEHGDLND
jgi:hypothetical protein